MAETRVSGASPPNAAAAAAPARTIHPEFTGSAGEYFRIWIVNLFFSLVTLGIYSAWAKVRKKKYFYGSTQLDGDTFDYFGRPKAILKGRIVAFLAFVIYAFAAELYPASRFGFWALAVDDMAEVVRVMSIVIEVDPNSGPAYSRRGWSYHRLGKPELAFPDYLAAAKLGEDWAELQVGKYYWSGTGIKQDRDEALVWLEKSAAKGNKDARVSLDQARKELGRKVE